MPDEKSKLGWEQQAGYQGVKETLQDTIIMEMEHPEVCCHSFPQVLRVQVFDAVVAGTRKIPESNRPKAILFEGPPGTGYVAIVLFR